MQQQSHPPHNIIHYETIDSVKVEARRLLMMGERTPVVVTASKMTNAEGRFGKKWHSHSEKNLHIAMGFIDPKPINERPPWGVLSGIEICKKLKKLFPTLDLKIKWPNDIYCNGKKISGMVTQTLIKSKKSEIVFALGLNVNSDPKKFPKKVQLMATSLKQELGKEVDMDKIRDTIIEAVSSVIPGSKEKSGRNIHKHFEKLDFLKGKNVLAVNGNIYGRACGIAETGELLIETDQGIQKIMSSDIISEKDQELKEILKNDGCHFFCKG